jgi:hypothetical protein
MGTRMKAVKKVQACIRAWLKRTEPSRKLLAGLSKPRSTRKVFPAVACVQRAWRVYSAKKEIEMRRLNFRKGWEIKEARERLRLRAITIQKYWKGCKAREFTKTVRKVRHTQAVAKLQAVWRYMGPLFKWLRMTEEHRALRTRCATLIQSGWRRYSTRLNYRVLRLKKKIDDMRQFEHQAAIKIQTYYRMHRAKPVIALKWEAREREETARWKAELARAQAEIERQEAERKRLAIKKEEEDAEIRREKLKYYEAQKDDARAVFMAIFDAEGEKVRKLASHSNTSDYRRMREAEIKSRTPAQELAVQYKAALKLQRFARNTGRAGAWRGPRGGTDPNAANTDQSADPPAARIEATQAAGSSPTGTGGAVHDSPVSSPRPEVHEFSIPRQATATIEANPHDFAFHWTEGPLESPAPTGANSPSPKARSPVAASSPQAAPQEPTTTAITNPAIPVNEARDASSELMEDAAALAIQSSMRGYLGRKQAAERRQERAQHRQHLLEDVAAKTIQNSTRSYMARNEADRRRGQREERKAQIRAEEMELLRLQGEALAQ